MKTAAAIKRASRQAQAAMRELDADSLDALIQIYQDAADQMRAAIRSQVDASDTVPMQNYRSLMQQVDDIITSLGQERDALLRRQIDEAATLGVRPYTAQGVGLVGGTQAVLDSAGAQRVHQAAVRFVLEFTAADGLQLSDRVWRLDQGAREVLQRAIGQAVVQGWSASKAVADLVYSGRAIPPDLAQRVAAAKAGQLVNVADLLTGEGGELWKAQRVMRTEINRAHGEAFMAAGERTPGFAGWRFLLSPQHPAPDICDLLAAQNIHGLGRGVYPDRASCPWPAHPNTLSFVEMVFQDEITDADRAGKETELQALQRLAPEIRAGVLGKTKAEYFDQGLLSKGEIRSSLRAVNDRISRSQPGDSTHPKALPGFDRAVFTPGKFYDYALNPEHRSGANKARVFSAALGYTRENGDALIEALRQGLGAHPARHTGETDHGSTYRVDIPVTGPAGSDIVRTNWILDPGSAVPRLTTVYVKNKRK